MWELVQNVLGWRGRPTDCWSLRWFSVEGTAGEEWLRVRRPWGPIATSVDSPALSEGLGL